jgi:hypothetical protein
VRLPALDPRRRPGYGLSPRMLGRWGFVPIAASCALFIAARAGSLVFPRGRASDRAVAGSVLVLAFVILEVRVLGTTNRLTGESLLGGLLAAALGLAVFSRPAEGGVSLRQLVDGASAPLVGCTCAAVVVAVLAAYWLPVWQWDALGYHLPYVNFVVRAGGLRGVPKDMPYVSTYPHNVEMMMVALRAMLPDDRLVDLAQIPFGLLGALTTAAIARRYAAPRPLALAAGAAWVLVPAVFLQMPTDYVDVACAALLLAAIYFLLAVGSAPGGRSSSTRRSLLVGGLALGLYLGSKPNAPVAAAIVAVLLLWVGRREGEGRVAVGALLLAAVFGAGTFVENAIQYGNPIWPVGVKFGPFALHGKTAMQHLLDSGAAAPRLHGSLPSRIIRSWTALSSPPVFDMRIGGFGPLVLLAAPAALATLLRRRDAVLWGAAASTLASPDPSVARYVLAFPALLLALAAPCAGALPRRALRLLGVLAGLLGVAEIAYAWPGLSGEGPPLLAYAHMSDPERAEAVGADGPPTPFVQARARIGRDETFAFDQSLELPYLAWESDLRYRAVWIPDNLTTDAVESFLKRENVRVVVAANRGPVGQWLRDRTDRFQTLFPCKSASCSVIARR